MINVIVSTGTPEIGVGDLVNYMDTDVIYMVGYTGKEYFLINIESGYVASTEYKDYGEFCNMLKYNYKKVKNCSKLEIEI